MPPLKGETYLTGLDVMRLPAGLWSGESMPSLTWDAVCTDGVVTRASSLCGWHLGSGGSLYVLRLSDVLGVVTCDDGCFAKIKTKMEGSVT
jgi:hypothetical protein